MKKRASSRIRNVFSKIINVRSWFDWDRVKDSSIYVAQGAQKIFSGPESSDQKLDVSFEQAVQEFNLTDKDLLIKQKALLRLSIVMLSIAVLIFVYAVYHLFFGGFKATIVSLAVMMIALALSFRYHFWYFQIKHQKLGCNFMQWFRQGILGEKE